MLASIAEGGERILHLVENFLVASRLDAGKLELSRAECDLHALACKVARFYERSASARGVRIELDLEPSSCLVTANEEGLNRVLSNLVTNAIKHSPPGEGVRVCLRSQGNAVVLSVSDRGPGIASQDQPRLFQRYSRISGNSRLGGTGLGLYIVKAIVEAHGGTVSVESALGQGARFTVCLPRE